MVKQEKQRITKKCDHLLKKQNKTKQTNTKTQKQDALGRRVKNKNCSEK